MSTITQKLEKVETKQKNFESEIQKVFNLLNHLYVKDTGMEKSILMIGKTITAIADLLIEKQIINNEELMNKIRLIEDLEQKNHIQNLLASKIIEQSNEVSENSLVVLKISTVNKQTQSETIISEYYVYSMKDTAQSTSKLPVDFTNHKVGDELEHENNDILQKYKILEIYRFVEKTEKTE